MILNIIFNIQQCTILAIPQRNNTFTIEEEKIIADFLKKEEVRKKRNLAKMDLDRMKDDKIIAFNP